MRRGIRRLVTLALLVGISAVVLAWADDPTFLPRSYTGSPFGDSRHPANEVKLP